MMISDEKRSIIVSSLGWVDRDRLWVFALPAARPQLVALGSGARHLSLHPGTEGYFAVCHHFEGERFEVTVHRYAAPAAILARASVGRGECLCFGNEGLWPKVPGVYFGYLGFEPWNDFVLIRISRSERGVDIQRFAWYDESYDKGYQGIVEVAEMPGEDVAIVSVQRSSRLVLHDLTSGTMLRAVDLAGRGGNPKLYLRQVPPELWASDYDTLVVVNPRTWQVERSARLQDADAGTRQFVGDYDFDAATRTCVLARPFSGDVVGLDPSTLRITSIARVGRQPLEVAALHDRQVVARDWKTGNLLCGELEPLEATEIMSG